MSLTIKIYLPVIIVLVITIISIIAAGVKAKDKTTWIMSIWLVGFFLIFGVSTRIYSGNTC